MAAAGLSTPHDKAGRPPWEARVRCLWNWEKGIRKMVKLLNADDTPPQLKVEIWDKLGQYGGAKPPKEIEQHTAIRVVFVDQTGRTEGISEAQVELLESGTQEGETTWGSERENSVPALSAGDT